MVRGLRHLRAPLGLALLALVAAGAAGGRLLSADHGVRLASRPGAPVRLALNTRTAPRAPQALQDDLTRIAAQFREPLGLAVTDVSAGWTAGVDQNRPYPQQSVSKLWVAISVMKAIDQGRLAWDAPIILTAADRSVFFQPVAYNIKGDGYQTRLSDLLRRALVDSDNAANDRLMREVGGPDGVAATLAGMGLTAVKVGAYERDLQARTAGMVWRPEYGIGWNFQAAREQLPKAEREAAMAAYLAAPPDGSSPAGITAALAALSRGELLSPDSTQKILSLMHAARTGPMRLKGGLPPGWSIAHKTGTGQDFEGYANGVNDVGLLTAPDGHVYAVAVMMAHTRKPVPERLPYMQAVTRAVAAQWARDTGGDAAL
jgi:beta-lactamase class A